MKVGFWRVPSDRRVESGNGERSGQREGKREARRSGVNTPRSLGDSAANANEQKAYTRFYSLFRKISSPFLSLVSFLFPSSLSSVIRVAYESSEWKSKYLKFLKRRSWFSF